MRDCEEFRADMRDDFTCVYNFSMTNVYVLVYYIIYEKLNFEKFLIYMLLSLKRYICI